MGHPRPGCCSAMPRTMAPCAKAGLMASNAKLPRQTGACRICRKPRQGASGHLGILVLAVRRVAGDMLDRDDLLALACRRGVTPWVPRPAIRIGLSPPTGMRMVWPPSVMQMIWSASSTGKAATSRPVPLVDRHRDDALAAAPRGPVLEGGRPLAVAVLGDGEHELLGRAHLGVALLAERARPRAAPSPLPRSGSAAAVSSGSPSPRTARLILR